VVIRGMVAPPAAESRRPGGALDRYRERD
jgi:hypothetical protein